MFCGDQTAEKRAKFCEGAFQDDMWTTRNLLESNEIYGTRACKSGYEGVIDEFDRFMSCHLIIKEPAEGIAGLYEAHLIAVMVIGGIAFGCGVVLYFYLRQKIKAMALKAKMTEKSKVTRSPLQRIISCCPRVRGVAVCGARIGIEYAYGATHRRLSRLYYLSTRWAFGTGCRACIYIALASPSMSWLRHLSLSPPGLFVLLARLLRFGLGWRLLALSRRLSPFRNAVAGAVAVVTAGPWIFNNFSSFH